jgi:hypothetical protein
MESLRSWNFLGGTGVSPLQAQAKACSYQILSPTIFVNPKLVLYSAAPRIPSETLKN